MDDRDLEELLKKPRESLECEIKRWLDLKDDEERALVAKAAIALANHGGGFLLIGYEEMGDSFVARAPKPSLPSTYSQDVINDIVSKFAEPVFHCELDWVRHPENGAKYPVIRVPGGHLAPIRSRRASARGTIQANTYYIRRPGPKSEPPQNGREWDELIRRCVLSAKTDLLDQLRSVIAGYSAGPSTIAADDDRTQLSEWTRVALERWQAVIHDGATNAANRFPFGHRWISYRVLGPTMPSSLSDFIDVLAKVRGRYTGWAPWWVPTKSDMAPYVFDDAIECWLGRAENSAAYSDFWRASPRGFMFLIRGYKEDSFPDKVQPGTVIDPVFHIWWLGECLLHAENLAKAIGGEGSRVLVRAHWSGLFDRRLRTAFHPELASPDDGPARQDQITREIEADAASISAQLPELVSKFLSPMFELFNFSKIGPGTFQRQLEQMRKNKHNDY